MVKKLKIIFLQDSWKKKLMNKFKNLHRPERAFASGISLSAGTSSKCPKILEYDHPSTNSAPSSSEMDEYNRNIKALKTYESKKWTITGMKSLVTVTSSKKSIITCIFVNFY